MKNELQEILTNAWQLIVRGAADKKSPLRTPVIGTIGENATELRTVVLRKVWSKDRKIHIHTDIRSPKITELQANPILSFLFYHPKKQIQIRLKAQTNILNQDESCRQYWDNIPDFARQNYCTDLAPSTKIDEYSNGLTEDWQKHTEQGFVNFAIIESSVFELEYLKLGRDAHQRAIFNYQNENWIGSWMIP